MSFESFNASSTSRQAGSREPAGRFSFRWLRLALAVVVVALVVTSVVFVDERESVIIERFGNIVRVYDRDADRGVHFKLPWPIDAARRFDRRVQLFEPAGHEMFTSDKKNVTVDIYICWRIAEPPGAAVVPLSERPVVRFYRGLGTADVAEMRLESRVRSILSTSIGQIELSRLLGVKSSEQGPDRQDAGRLETLSDTVHRETMQRPNESDSLLERLGIEIVDLRITRLNLPLGNQQAVFARMRSERKKVADRYRAAGLADSQMIRSQADRQYNEVLAKARADAERIRGTAEAESIRILNAAHAQDPEFYAVLAALDAQRKILNEKTTLVLSASSSLLKLLTEGVPDLKSPPTPPAHAPLPGKDPSPTALKSKADAGSKGSGVDGGTR